VPASEVTGLLVVSNDAIDKADARLRTLLDSSTRLEQVGHSISILRR
jgi:hypothetical protein